MYYRFPDKLPKTFFDIFQNCNIKGKDAQKIIHLEKALNEKKSAPYYLIDDKLVKFVLETLDQLTIPVRLAVLIVDIQIALTNPYKTIPVEKIENPVKATTPASK